MYYKVNQLNEPVECDSIKYSELPSLLFGKLTFDNDEIGVFNASEYCKSLGGRLDVYKFMQSNKLYIDRLVNNEKVNPDKLFFIHSDKQILIASEIAIVFLMSINPELFLYFVDMILDLLSGGIAVSDRKIMELVMDRVPNDVLNQIINSRNEKDENGG